MGKKNYPVRDVYVFILFMIGKLKLIDEVGTN